MTDKINNQPQPVSGLEPVWPTPHRLEVNSGNMLGRRAPASEIVTGKFSLFSNASMPDSQVTVGDYMAMTIQSLLFYKQL